MVLQMGAFLEPGERWHEDIGTIETYDGHSLAAMLCHRRGSWFLVCVIRDTGERLCGLKITHDQYALCRNSSMRCHIVSFLRKVDQVRRIVEERATLSESKWLQDHPAVGEYLTTTEWPDGGQRQTSTLLVFYEAGEVRVCLNDREQGRSLWATGSTLEGAFLALENRCKDEKAEWRVSVVTTKPSHKHNKNRK